MIHLGKKWVRGLASWGAPGGKGGGGVVGKRDILNRG